MSFDTVHSEVSVQAAIYLEQASPDDHTLPFHAQSVESTLTALAGNNQGLSSEEVILRQKQVKRAHLDDLDFTSPKQIFLNGFKKRVTLLYVVAAGMSLGMQHWMDAALIVAAMMGNGAMQAWIQWKTLRNQKTYDESDSIRCMVRRDGQTQTVDARELVPGDILLINSGQVMPADARLISSYQMQADESLLTGESVLVPKNANITLHPMEDVTAQCNMLFAGTVVKTGKGEAVVTAMGANTVMGRIASMSSNTVKRESPFTKKLNALSLKLFLLVMALAAVTIGIAAYQGVPLPQLIQLGLVLAIAAFPETIPNMAGLILGMGIGRLNEKKVLVKSFQALESIGDVTTICTDKTGTLTENYLTFDRLFVPELGSIPYDPEWLKAGNLPSKLVEEFLRVGRLNNGTMVEGLRSPLMGDPIDVALYRAAPPLLEAGYHARVSIPFDPVKLRSATICETPDGSLVSMIKGAPEAVMEISKYYMRPDGSINELSITQRTELLMFNRKLAYEHNLRVIGFAQKPMTDDDHTGPYSDAVFLGWVCLLDPAKPGVLETVTHLQNTGARLIMITGDQRATAEITARELGIIRRKSDEVWLRSDLEAAESDVIPETVKVFARTKPEEKLAIVESLQKSGQVVAMVGDGVNDSPALQKSDVAIAMGLQGSAAAKESADIILMNDRLEGIVAAVLESRVLRRKIQSCMRYLVSCNMGLVLFVMTSALLGHAMSLSVVQILWLNMVMAMIPALVLAVEPVDESELMPPAIDDEAADQGFLDKMKRQQQLNQQHQQRNVLSNPLDGSAAFLAAYWAVLMAGSGVAAYYLSALAFHLTPEVSATAAFCTVALGQVFNLFNVQALNAGENRRQFMRDLSTTPITWLVVLAALLLQAAVVYIPVLNSMVMGTVPLPMMGAWIPPAVAGCALLLSLKTMKV